MCTILNQAKKNKIAGFKSCGLILLLFVIFITGARICTGAPAGDKQSDNALGAMPIAPEVLVESDPVEMLPVSESSNDGYWWNKQDKETKTQYIKQLIELFGVSDKKLEVRKIIKELDSLYDPKDNPLDIKIDISVERMFNEVIK